MTQPHTIGRTTLELIMVALTLMGVHVASAAVSWRQPARLHDFLSLNTAASLGEWYASVQFLFCAILLTLIARSEFGRAHRRYWGSLAAGFYGLSVAEGAQLHELLTHLMHRATWPFSGLAIVAVVGLSYFRFLRMLPRRTAMQFAVAGAIFVLGVFGTDLIGGSQYGAMADLFCRGDLNCGLGFSVMVALEEGMELIGITIFANALLHICLAACPKLVTALN
jgi:hypothetical protein